MLPKYGRAPPMVPSPSHARGVRRTSWRIFPGCSSLPGSLTRPWRAARAASVSIICRGRNARAWWPAMRLSRPKSATNHGMPGGHEAAPRRLAVGHAQGAQVGQGAPAPRAEVRWVASAPRRRERGPRGRAPSRRRPRADGRARLDGDPQPPGLSAPEPGRPARDAAVERIGRRREADARGQPGLGVGEADPAGRRGDLRRTGARRPTRRSGRGWRRCRRSRRPAPRPPPRGRASPPTSAGSARPPARPPRRSAAARPPARRPRGPARGRRSRGSAPSPR